jgi:hypothetical protein
MTKKITKPSFQPTAEQRKIVEAMAAYGVPGTEIARVIAIGYTTLKKYFRDELDLAHIRANVAVAETAFKMATSGKCPAATFFWLKTRARWRETNHHQHSGAVGTYDLTKISDADLSRVHAILAVAVPGGGGGGDGEAGGGSAA